MKTSSEGLALIQPGEDVAAAEAAVSAAVTAAIPQNRFDALVSVVASGLSLEPRAIDFLNNDDAPGAASVLNEVVMHGDRYPPEQINRRAAEVRLFSRGF